VRNEYRRRMRHRLESLEQLQADGAGGTMGGWQPADERGADPAALAAERELRRQIRAAVQTLPDAQRTAVILCRYEGWAHEDIAQVLRCSVSAVKSLLYRARVALKEQLRGHY